MGLVFYLTDLSYFADSIYIVMTDSNCCCGVNGTNQRPFLLYIHREASAGQARRKQYSLVPV